VPVKIYLATWQYQLIHLNYRLLKSILLGDVNMSIFRQAVSAIIRAFPSENGYAHCDIPCGIYDPITAKIAAQTVQKMVIRIQALKKPESGDSSDAWATYENTLGRLVTVKEEHAQVCKNELSILWSDYFKPEHLEKYPDLHDTFWKAAKLCGANKQRVDLDASKDLVATVDKLAETFWATKNTVWQDTVSDVRFGS
jgi:nickel superoxide dismutase